MHELYRVLSAISADTFSQHFRTYFIIPCNPMIYKHLKLLLRPQWSGDIRTVRAREGSNIQKRAIHRMSLFCIIESTRRRRTSGGRSTATTGAERRHSNRSSPAGLEHRKKSHPSDDSFFYLIESTRRRRTSGGRSTATTGAERRHSNRSSLAGLEHRKKSHPSDDSFFYLLESTRRDSNPRPSPWQGDTPPLSHSCKHTFKTTY